MASRLVEQLGAQNAAGATAAALAGQIRALILDGRLTVGERLPSERALALELQRSRSTMTRVYSLLERDGYVTRLHGGSTRVTLPHRDALTYDTEVDSAIDLSIAAMDSTPGLYDATVRSLPRLAALRNTSGYSLRGLPELREAVAQRFIQRGVPTSANDIIITSGALNAVNLVLATIARRGERALVEQPTFPHALDALRRNGYRLLPTPVGGDGWDTGHLTDLLLRAKPLVGYLIPDFHNPTGATMTDADRERIAATARASGTRLIVDETTSELDIDRGWTPLPLAAFSPEIVTVGSMSKIAWGGLRLGWIRAERSLIDRLLAVRPSFELGTALLDQCIAVELLDEMPALTEHVRTRLHAGRAAVAAGLADIGDLQFPRTPGGLSSWIDLGAPISTRLSLAARDRRLIAPPGPRFSTGGVLERYLRIPITHPPERTTEAMARLQQAWNDVREGASARPAEATHAPVI
ncbi:MULTISPECIES: PLP-dependent aminotransferase family protein [unclassified Microbacterium]|uniref:MocR-like transcription factor YczR n=1 Tax=unclassified Microbacterium TaxID=2609290 RepID=UPI000EA853D2|nr:MULTISPECIES: PLP-dependent aminotransferase family protein [unclassified Microbacterium]MBT2486094.1 PLP-dependent aminotransferase family protein [Microbacterium sp. ISL-108]RKN68825.1 PLP-dependent aminotransferase family protein [Microbacterium sp. CGR2]